MPIYLEGIAVQFYRGIGPETQYIAPFSDLNFFVGANNSGKSIVLNLIKDRLPGPEPILEHQVGTGSTVTYIGEQQGGFHMCLGLRAETFLQYCVSHVQQKFEGYRPRGGLPILDLSSYEKNISKVVRNMERISGFWFEVGSGKPRLVDVKPGVIEELSKCLSSYEWMAIGDLCGFVQQLTLEGSIKETVSNISKAVVFDFPQRMIVPAKREIRANAEAFDDASGKGLIKHLAEIQNPDFNERERKDVFDQINAFLQMVTDKPDARLEVPNHREHLLVHMDNKVLPLSSLGTGIHEVVLIAAFCTIHQQKIMCIEEPEIHLHPVLQRKLIKYLQDKTENQYFIATHSAAFIDTPGASVFHVRNDGVQTYVDAAITKGDQRNICDELGYRASDILQANAVIWVEGPSDRIYIRHWLKVWDDRLIEGVHYTIMFYGGGLITHLSGDDSAIEDFIKLRDLNRNIAIVIDSDKGKPRAPLKEAAQRLKEEMSKGGGFVWITKGREIENYVPHDRIQDALKQLHPKIYGGPSESGQYDHAFYFLRKGAKAGDDPVYRDGDKVGAATIVCSDGDAADLNVLDLREQATKLAQMIIKANGLERRN